MDKDKEKKDKIVELEKKAWALRAQTQGNIFACYAALITEAEDPVKYVYENARGIIRNSEIMEVFRNWKNNN